MKSSEKTLVCCAAWCLALAGAVVASACSGGESADPVDSTEPDAAAPKPDAGDPPDGDVPEAEAGPDAAPDAPTDAPAGPDLPAWPSRPMTWTAANWL